MLSVHSCPIGTLGAKDTGGMNVYVRELAGELGKQGHIVDIFTRVHDLECSRISEIGSNARLIHLKAGDDRDIHKLAIYSYLPDFACSLENFRKQDNLHYDIIFSHYWLSGLVGQSLQTWWNVPHVTMFHTLGAVKNTLGIGEDDPELRIEAEKDLVRDCHRIIAATEKEKLELSGYYGAELEKIGVIPCGVNMEMFQPIDKKEARKKLGLGEEHIVLFVGRIEPLKGIERILQAMTLMQNGSHPKLVIVGGDHHSQDELTRLQQLSTQLGIEKSVLFTGIIEHDRLPYYYSAADTCVIPSYYESFGLTALESLACGTPVVATNVGGLNNVIQQGKTGYVIDKYKPEALAEKITLTLSRQNTEMKSAYPIRDTITDYSWSNIAHMIIEDFNRVTNNCLLQVS